MSPEGYPTVAIYSHTSQTETSISSLSTDRLHALIHFNYPNGNVEIVCYGDEYRNETNRHQGYEQLLRHIYESKIREIYLASLKQFGSSNEEIDGLYKAIAAVGASITILETEPTQITPQYVTRFQKYHYE